MRMRISLQGSVVVCVYKFCSLDIPVLVIRPHEKVLPLWETRPLKLAHFSI